MTLDDLWKNKEQWKTVTIPKGILNEKEKCKKQQAQWILQNFIFFMM